MHEQDIQGRLHRLSRSQRAVATHGHKFDSSLDHPAQPVVGMDGKPEKGDDGKPKMAPGQPILFPQGMRRSSPVSIRGLKA